MSTYVWCEDSGSGYAFWNTVFKIMYPEFIVETKNSNTRLNKAIRQISDDNNLYYVIVDTVLDNQDVLRELERLKRSIIGKNNIKVIKIHSFEFSLLSFEFLEKWVFAENDDLKEQRKDKLEAREKLVKLISDGGTADELSLFKSVYQYQSKMNTEKIVAKLLTEITRNTGFETNKKQVGFCFVNSCCEWDDRQENDLCGLDDKRLSVSEKIEQMVNHSILQAAFQEVGL
ncbi:hypothetical protein [uncultured Ruminococcus sp.]|uniref:hypothetical protein n=1 Tax=uncultured Ruminococcus sp. TaxID=165186 RepID=UPI002674A2E3|nr:hypothetical protein [uncultured Ruminococcus sp.]